MKALTYILTALLLGLANESLAQDFTGLATYKSAMKMEVTTDSTKMSAEQQDQIQASIMNAMRKEYELSFTKSESNWKELESLEKTPATQSGIQINIVGLGGGSDGLLYKNTKDKKMLETTDAFGKLFLISGDLEPYDWEMTSETKQIGKYTCYKAIAQREVTEIRISEVDGERKEKEEKGTQTMTAWYTPEIPVNHGPDGYWGLPGLILEVSNGNRVMVCSKVVLNPKEEVVIAIPAKGKKVSREEYETIMREQTEKMNKMYGSGGKKKGKDGTTMEIRIQG